MSSHAFTSWSTTGKKALDSIAAAHRAVGGHGRGRRFATQEINHAYAVMLASQFQKFCRDLHTEAVSNLVAAVSPSGLSSVLRTLMLEGRKLDKGNPTPGNLGADFNRLGLQFWTEVNRLSPLNQARRARLDQLCAWRNAIAHQDFHPTLPLDPPPPLHLTAVVAWRSACNALAQQFDRCLSSHVLAATGHRPW